MGFHVLETDSSMYIHGNITPLECVDVILIAGPSMQAWKATATDLSRKFEVVNKEIMKKPAIAISQHGYISINYLLNSI